MKLDYSDLVALVAAIVYHARGNQGDGYQPDIYEAVNTAEGIVEQARKRGEPIFAPIEKAAP